MQQVGLRRDDAVADRPFGQRGAGQDADAEEDERGGPLQAEDVGDALLDGRFGLAGTTHHEVVRDGEAGGDEGGVRGLDVAEGEGLAHLPQRGVGGGVRAELDGMEPGRPHVAQQVGRDDLGPEEARPGQRDAAPPHGRDQVAVAALVVVEDRVREEELPGAGRLEREHLVDDGFAVADADPASLEQGIGAVGAAAGASALGLERHEAPALLVEIEDRRVIGRRHHAVGVERRVGPEEPRRGRLPAGESLRQPDRQPLALADDAVVRPGEFQQAFGHDGEARAADDDGGARRRADRRHQHHQLVQVVRLVAGVDVVQVPERDADEPGVAAGERLPQPVERETGGQHVELTDLVSRARQRRRDDGHAERVDGVGGHHRVAGQQENPHPAGASPPQPARWRRRPTSGHVPSWISLWITLRKSRAMRVAASASR